MSFVVCLLLTVPLGLPLPPAVRDAIREDFSRGVSAQEIVKKYDAKLVAVLHAVADLRRPR